MKNKVLINLVVPELDMNFDVFIPVNEYIWRIKKLFLKSISDLANLSLNPELDYILLNKDTGKLYTNNQIIMQTDIRNGTELFFISNR